MTTTRLTRLENALRTTRNDACLRERLKKLSVRTLSQVHQVTRSRRLKNRIEKELRRCGFSLRWALITCALDRD